MADALIVIDMQVGCFSEAARRHDADGLVDRLNALATHIRDAGGLVIFVQHRGPPGDALAPDAPGWQLLPNLRREAGDMIVGKTTCDSFYDTGLEDLLRGANAARVILTGCATDFCVDTSVRAAALRGFDTWAPSDGHTTSERAYLSAAKIIEHHNAIWADFIAPNGPVRVCPIAKLMTI